MGNQIILIPLTKRKRNGKLFGKVKDIYDTRIYQGMLQDVYTEGAVVVYLSPLDGIIKEEEDISCLTGNWFSGNSLLSWNRCNAVLLYHLCMDECQNQVVFLGNKLNRYKGFIKLCKTLGIDIKTPYVGVSTK